MLPMVKPIEVVIVGAPIACADGVKDTWRELAGWVAAQIEHRFGDQVQIGYQDLFDSACPPLPPEATLPVVFVDGEVVSAGGKLSIPLIRRAVEARGVAQGHPVSA
jgi:disulfide oxidoreductase YuzD